MTLKNIGDPADPHEVEALEKGWRPTSQEVAEIIRELRPVIAKVAAREQLARVAASGLRIA